MLDGKAISLGKRDTKTHLYDLQQQRFHSQVQRTIGGGKITVQARDSFDFFPFFPLTFEVHSEWQNYSDTQGKVRLLRIKGGVRFEMSKKRSEKIFFLFHFRIPVQSFLHERCQH